MKSAIHTRRLFGWMGTLCLLLIIPIKALRLVNGIDAVGFVWGISPSVFGPAGLLFLLLSDSGRLARLTILQIALLVTAIALGLEFIQVFPRPGILANVHYTFDWGDVIASLLSVAAAYGVALYISREKRTD